MLNDATCFKQVFIVTGYTDLRSGIDHLAGIIESQTEKNLYARHAIPLQIIIKNNCLEVGFML